MAIDKERLDMDELDALLEEVRDDNRHEEDNIGDAEGREAW